MRKRLNYQGIRSRSDDTRSGVVGCVWLDFACPGNKKVAELSATIVQGFG
jgi:hypothetical protein